MCFSVSVPRKENLKIEIPTRNKGVAILLLHSGARGSFSLGDHPHDGKLAIEIVQSSKHPLAREI